MHAGRVIEVTKASEVRLSGRCIGTLFNVRAIWLCRPTPLAVERSTPTKKVAALVATTASAQVHVMVAATTVAARTSMSMSVDCHSAGHENRQEPNLDDVSRQHYWHQGGPVEPLGHPQRSEVKEVKHDDNRRTDQGSHESF